MGKKINVLLVEPNEYPKMIEIENTLKAMQEIVGGYIETCMPYDDEISLICNDEGKLNGLTLNRAIYSEEKELVEIIAGKFFVCHAPHNSENFQSLPKNLIEKYETLFKYPEKFYKDYNNEIVVESYEPTVTKDREL